MGVPNTAQLHYIEVMCESVLQGMYTVLVVVVIWLLCQPRPMPTIHRIMFSISIVMWMISSAHVGLLIQQVTQTVTPVRNAQAQLSIATIQFMLADLIMIWRVWVVWGGNYLVALLPTILMLVAAGLRFDGAATILTFAARPHIADVAAALIASNVLLCTLLIAGRIWYLQWQMSKILDRSPPHQLNKGYNGVLMLIIESGALYAVAQLLALILDDVHSPGVHAVLDMQLPLAGMLPTLIVVVVHFDLVPGTHATETYNNTTSIRFGGQNNPEATTRAQMSPHSRQKPAVMLDLSPTMRVREKSS
ncbi:hypothetical protein GALMADRAFT_265018 [Galerina marginata CBS 339.88]|uniref:Uncharacterized protein n=1 Tax=Galerina marginata (strain CBS 339.88) TaxID=685588 RepID=A0A067TFQ0_GALM3|nr:hypothetical protein GALMADRAFT_265018 [Galerina marginata CBS 339.88]